MLKLLLTITLLTLSNIVYNTEVEKIVPKRNILPLLNAIKKNNFESALNIINENYFEYDFDLTDDDGDTPLIILTKRYTEVIQHPDPIFMKFQIERILKLAEIILKNGASVNIQGFAKSTALIQACWRGFSDMVQLLLNNNANPNIQDGYTQTALMYVVMSHTQEHLKILKLLLQKDIDINLKNNEDQTALDIAEFYENKKAIKLLKRYKQKGCQSCVIL